MKKKEQENGSDKSWVGIPGRVHSEKRLSSNTSTLASGIGRWKGGFQAAVASVDWGGSSDWAVIDFDLNIPEPSMGLEQIPTLSAQKQQTTHQLTGK